MRRNIFRYPTDENTKDFIHHLMSTGRLKRKTLQKLNITNIENLADSHIQRLVMRDLISVTEALFLTVSQRERLQCRMVQYLIEVKQITLQQAMQLNHYAHEALKNTAIQRLLRQGFLELKDVLALNFEGLANLNKTNIQELIRQGKISAKRAIRLSYTERENLQVDLIFHLVMQGHINLSQAFSIDYLTRDQLASLEKTNSVLKWREKTEHILGILLPNVPDLFGQLCHRTELLKAKERFNPEESTLNPVIRASISTSVRKLAQQYYGGFITDECLQTELMHFSGWVYAIPENNQQIEKAKHCFFRMIEQDYTDEMSGITLRQLLGIVWKIKNDPSLDIDEESFTIQLFEGLYEIQRGNNAELNNHQSNTHWPEYVSDEDREICLSGAFNKLMEKLEIFHPAVQIYYISPEMAALKFPIIVNETIVRYLTWLPSFNLGRFFYIHALLAESKNIAVIWPEIQSQVTQLVYQEFRELYSSIHSRELTAFVNCAVDVELIPLPHFQRQILASSAHSHYSFNLFKRSLSVAMSSAAIEESHQEGVSYVLGK